MAAMMRPWRFKPCEHLAFTSVYVFPDLFGGKLVAWPLASPALSPPRPLPPPPLQWLANYFAINLPRTPPSQAAFSPAYESSYAAPQWLAWSLTHADILNGEIKCQQKYGGEARAILLHREVPAENWFSV